MRDFSGDTNVAHEHELLSDIRAYFSATAARIREDIWLRVETRWVADGTPVEIAIFREDDDGAREAVGSVINGTVSGNEFEKQWRVELPSNRLDEIHGAIYLVFEARLDKHPLPAKSQRLLILRTRFSS